MATLISRLNTANTMQDRAALIACALMIKKEEGARRNRRLYDKLVAVATALDAEWEPAILRAKCHVDPDSTFLQGDAIPAAASGNGHATVSSVRIIRAPRSSGHRSDLCGND